MITPATPIPSTKSSVDDYAPIVPDKAKSVFSPLETAAILHVKTEIKNHLNNSNFNLTLRTLGRNMEHCYFVSGGCIGSLLRGEPVNDYDLYFYSQFQADPVIRLYTEEQSYQNEVKDIDDKYRDTFVTKITGKLITENAITLKNKIQLITKHYGEPEEVRKTFDFVHCMPYYNSRDDRLYISRDQYDLNMNKKLVINNTDTWTRHREEKFVKRGWTKHDNTYTT